MLRGSFNTRNAHGQREKRTETLRLRLEPTVRDLAERVAAETGSRPYRDHRGPGLSAYLRDLIARDLVMRGLAVLDGGELTPAPDKKREKAPRDR